MMMLAYECKCVSVSVFGEERFIPEMKACSIFLVKMQQLTVRVMDSAEPEEI